MRGKVVSGDEASRLGCEEGDAAGGLASVEIFPTRLGYSPQGSRMTGTRPHLSGMGSTPTRCEGIHPAFELTPLHLRVNLDRRAPASRQDGRDWIAVLGIVDGRLEEVAEGEPAVLFMHVTPRGGCARHRYGKPATCGHFFMTCGLYGIEG